MLIKKRKNSKAQKNKKQKANTVNNLMNNNLIDKLKILIIKINKEFHLIKI